MVETKESIEKALKERLDLIPKFRKVLEDKLKEFENKGYQERMVTIKK